MERFKQLRDVYKDGGIWTFNNSRTSCLVPEKPLYISSEEERELNELSLGVYNALKTAVEIANESNERPWRDFYNTGRMFPDGLSMPPVVRADIVRTPSGPRVVEIDPITAISLGETCFLADAWGAAGYGVVASPLEQIRLAIKDRGSSVLGVTVPIEKREYTTEIQYLANKLDSTGITIQWGDRDSLQLSSFMENPSSRKAINGRRYELAQNPLWGSLYGFAGKDSLALLRRCDERLQKFMVREYLDDEIAELGSDERLIAKPKRGTGSVGLRVVSSCEAKNMTGYVFQEPLVPRIDEFGLVYDGNDKIIESAAWVTRLSIYASSKGFAGAQVTARQMTGMFTNVDGKADAIQTSLIIDN